MLEDIPDELRATAYIVHHFRSLALPPPRPQVIQVRCRARRRWAGTVGAVSPGLLAGLIWFTFGIAATNRFHQWAHADAVPGWVATLQRGGWILSPEKHARHHAGAHDRAYCVTTGWLNPLLDAVRFFGRLEGSIRWLGSRRRARFARSLRSD